MLLKHVWPHAGKPSSPGIDVLGSSDVVVAACVLDTVVDVKLVGRTEVEVRLEEEAEAKEPRFPY